MLGIIVCQLQPSKSTFEIIKENFLFICLFVVLPYFFYLVRTKSPNRDNPAKTKSFGLVPCLLLTQEIISEWRGTNPLTLGVGKEERNGEGIEERGKVSHPSPLCFFVFHSLPSAFCAYQACGRNIFSAFLFRGMGGGGGEEFVSPPYRTKQDTCLETFRKLQAVSLLVFDISWGKSGRVCHIPWLSWSKQECQKPWPLSMCGHIPAWVPPPSFPETLLDTLVMLQCFCSFGTIA